jgi:hypothetical protein
MNGQHKTTRSIPAMEVSEGAGVTVQRTIGTPALRNYDLRRCGSHRAAHHRHAGFTQL